MTEILKQKLSPVEQCFVESGFCAYLVLNYTDPEKPQLEALNSVSTKKIFFYFKQLQFLNLKPDFPPPSHPQLHVHLIKY